MMMMVSKYPLDNTGIGTVSPLIVMLFEGESLFPTDSNRMLVCTY